MSTTWKWRDLEDEQSEQIMADLMSAYLACRYTEEIVVHQPKKQPTDDRHDAVMLTVNPKPDVSIEDFFLKVNRFAERRTVSPYLWAYAFEQRSTGDDYHGHHCHMLFYGQRPSAILRDAQSTFKKMVGNATSSHHINVKRVNYDAGHRYIEGFKKGILKVTHASDLIWRSENNIADIYTPQ